MVLEGVDAGFDVGGGIAGVDGDSGLKEDGAFVVAFADLMDGNAGHGVAGGYHSFVHAPAIHAFAAVAWEERGMDVDYTAFVTVDEEGGNHHKESGKYNDVYGIAVHEREHKVRVGELGAGQNSDRHVQPVSSPDDSGIGTIGDNERYFGPAVGTGVEVTYYSFGI